MCTRQAWIPGGCLIACCLILGAWLGQPTVAQQRAPQAIGRFQGIPGHAGSRCLVLDTASGHCWELVNDEWRDLGSPMSAPQRVKQPKSEP